MLNSYKKTTNYLYWMCNKSSLLLIERPIFLQKGVIKSTFLIHLIFLFFLVVISYPNLVAAQSTDPKLRAQFEKSFKEVPSKVDLKKSIGLLVRNQNKEQETGASKRLLSDLIKSSFLKLSNYQSNIIDLSELENIWEKSIEFNGVEFDELFDDAKFDVFAVADYAPVKKGLLFSINFYDMDNGSQGATLHTIPSQLLEIDWSLIEEVEILSAGQAKALSASVELILKRQEVVQNPKIFEEHYANYEIHESNGKSLKAITSLVNAIILKPDFVDLITDVTRLSRSYFGGDASKYLEKALYPHLHPQLVDFSKLLLDPNYDIFSSCKLNTARLSDCKITVDSIVFPQLLNLFVNTQAERYAANQKNWGVKEVREYVVLQATRSVLEAYRDGSISDNYFNKLRSIAEVDQSRLLDFEQKLNTASFIPVKIKSYILGSGNSLNMPPFKSSVNNGRLTLQFLPLEDSSGTLEGKRNEISAPPLEFYDFSTSSFEGGGKNAAGPNTKEIFQYLPPKNMVGGARDVLDFMDHRNLGPCGFSNGRHSRDGADYKTYTPYFYSVEERSDIINDYAPDFPSDIRNDAISYWKSLPILDSSLVENVSGLFRASYLTDSNNYLPQNQHSWTGEGRSHGDKFLSPENDRLIWADVCIVNMMRAIANSALQNTEYVELRYTKDGIPIFDFNALASLYITDSVDTSKPIYVSTSNDDGNSVEWARLDISSDGTYFDPNGVNLDVTQFVRYTGYNVLHENNWLFAPGIVQSSIGLNDIDEIRYTDIYGNEKFVNPSKSHLRSSWSQLGNTVIDRNDEYLQDLANLRTPKEYFSDYSDLNYSLFEVMGINLSSSLRPNSKKLRSPQQKIRGELTRCFDSGRKEVYSTSRGATCDTNDRTIGESTYKTFLNMRYKVRNEIPGDSVTLEARNYQKPNWCVQAQSVLELKICSNSKLSELDIQFTTLYGNVRSEKKAKAKVIATSSYQNRVKCASNTDCIKSNYTAVIADLTALSKVDIFPITCAFKNTSGSVTNVQNFTNLRQESYLQSKIIDRVPLGASVKIRQPGTYWRPDKCAAACNGTNQNAIKQCIDNNDVWIEVEHNGRRGFLSRKFLE